MLREGEIVNDLNVKTRDRLSVVMAFLLLLALPAGLLWPPALALGAVAAIILLAANADFFRFLKKVRGLSFALRALPLYWLYLLICGAGFGAGFVSHLARRT